MFAAISQQLFVKFFKFDAAFGGKHVPTIVGGDLVFGTDLRHHFEEEDISQLGNVLMVNDAVVTKDVAQVPEFADKKFVNTFEVAVHFKGSPCLVENGFYLFKKDARLDAAHIFVKFAVGKFADHKVANDNEVTSFVVDALFARHGFQTVRRVMVDKVAVSAIFTVSKYSITPRYLL